MFCSQPASGLGLCCSVLLVNKRPPAYLTIIKRPHLRGLSYQRLPFNISSPVSLLLGIMLSFPLTILATASVLLESVSAFSEGSVLDRHLRGPKKQDLINATEPIPPLQDPWYTAPRGFEKKRPGTVLRIREAPGNLTSLATDCSAAYNILYRTTGSRYQPDWAVTTIFVPAAPAAALLSYQIP